MGDGQLCDQVQLGVKGTAAVASPGARRRPAPPQHLLLFQPAVLHLLLIAGGETCTKPDARSPGDCRKGLEACKRQGGELSSSAD